jgi:arsenate reductase
LNQLAGDKFEAESAGLEPGELNPLVVKAMQEVGIDISGNKTKSVFDFYKQGRSYNYVITVCDESQSEQCPIFPGIAKKLHWGFSDPSSFQGTGQEKLKKVKRVRDEIKATIEKWLEIQTL